ncbi:hypothetical protein ABZZ37_13770 [Streptomyces sp. NPDC006464]|uniref:hypothetical protein n=1 Tax=unclassified Streptomyces TaxID=2593676 RepID=UPI0033BF4FFD
MTDMDAAQLLDRIRRARDWARRREQESITSYVPSDDSSESFAATLDGVIHRVVADVLDEILEPSSEGRPTDRS